MKGFLTLDIVFEAQSLNYDQGIGNYQELKKIHKNGRVYTLVSRYAIRYSILEQGAKKHNWKLADRSILTEVGEKDNKVIQPNVQYSTSRNGENSLSNLPNLLDYVDLNLFGFLITNFISITKNKETKNISLAREAPVKITHAISMEPFKFDSHFNANIGLSKRYYGFPYSQNIFQVEEHRSYYKYSVIIELAKIGTLEAYFSTDLLEDEIIKKIKEIESNSNKKVELDEETLKGKGICILRVKNNEDNTQLIEQLVNVILDLKRNIKGRVENLEPVFMVASYDEKFYDTCLNYIELETTNSRVTEIEEKSEDGKLVRRISERKLDGVVFNLKRLPTTKDWFVYTPSKELISSSLLNQLGESNKSETGTNEEKVSKSSTSTSENTTNSKLITEKNQALERIKKWIKKNN